MIVEHDYSQPLKELENTGNFVGMFHERLYLHKPDITSQSDGEPLTVKIVSPILGSL